MIGTATNQIAPLATMTSTSDVPPDPTTLSPGQLQFQMISASSAAAPSIATLAPVHPAPTSVDALSGFTVQASDDDRRKLEAAVQRIGSSAIGSELLATVRDRGIGMQALDDAAFDQATRGAATDAVAVFISGGTAGAQLLVRASALTATSGDVDAPEHVIAHELAHAAQYVAGEGSATYRAGVGAAAARLGAEQLRTAETLMAESGAELLATGMMAQLQSPERFNAVGAARIAESSSANWARVAKVAAYNPGGDDLPQFVSPEATRILRAGLPTTPVA